MGGPTCGFPRLHSGNDVCALPLSSCLQFHFQVKLRFHSCGQSAHPRTRPVINALDFPATRFIMPQSF